jgi:hypothetical protein
MERYKSDNLIELSEEEMRVKHGGPLKSRRRSQGKLAPELGQDYISTDQIPNQDKQDGSDVGHDVDGSFTIGEDEIIEQIDEKIAQKKILKGYMAKQPKEGEVLVWHRDNPKTEKKQGSESHESTVIVSPQYSPDAGKERIINLKAGRGSGYYRKDTRGEYVSRYKLLQRKKLIETKREMTNRAKKAEKNRILKDHFTVPKVRKKTKDSYPVRRELRN